MKMTGFNYKITLTWMNIINKCTKNIYIHIKDTHMYTYANIYIHMFVCMYVHD